MPEFANPNAQVRNDLQKTNNEQLLENNKN